MRIALVIERFEPPGEGTSGGMESVAWTLAHRLAASGDEVHVVARRAAASATVTVHRVRVPASWQPIRAATFARASLRRARALEPAADVVHAFSRTPGVDLFRAGGGCHAAYMERVYGPVGSRARRITPRHALLLALERRLFADPAVLVQCVSQMVADEIGARFEIAPERLRVIHNGVDTERFSPGAGAASERSSLAVSEHEPPSGPVWLVAGSGWHRKGLDTALAAMARAKDGDARLWVAGRDDPAPWLGRAAQLGLADRVRFLGPRSDVERLYRAADALLLPTRYDAFSNATLEAAASGCPVVTSGANGCAEVLAPAGAALVVDDAEDVPGFAAALDRLDDASLREALGKRGRDLALSLSWERHVEQVRALYTEAAARRGAPA